MAANVVSHVLATELCAQTYLVALLQELLLQFHVAEGTACLVAGGGQRVIVVCGSQFHGKQVLPKEIMANMNIKETTLKYHNRNLYGKLGVASRKELLEIHKHIKSVQAAFEEVNNVTGK